MHYEKPLVIDLNSTARGAGPRLCLSGGAETDPDESCSTGTGAGWSCAPGTSGGGNALCVGGTNPGDQNDCASGTTVSGFCLAGPSPLAGSTGCRVGPSAV